MLGRESRVSRHPHRTPPPYRPHPRPDPRPAHVRAGAPEPGAPERSSPSGARRCFKRVSTSFLGSSTFWGNFFTSLWLLRENIPLWGTRPRRRGRRRLPRGNHYIWSGSARVPRATRHSRQAAATAAATAATADATAAASAVATRRRGGPSTAKGGAGRRCRRGIDGPAPREAPAGPSGAAHEHAI